MDLIEKSVSRATAPRHHVSRASRPKRSDAKRDKIVWAAAKLFLAKGYDSVSINDIIVVVGGSKSTIYSKFGNKEKLFEAVVAQMCSEVTIQIDTRPEGTLDQQRDTYRIFLFVESAVAANIVLPSTDHLDRPGFPGDRATVLQFRTADSLSDYRGVDCPTTKGGQHPRRRRSLRPRHSVSRHADRRSTTGLADIDLQREGSHQAHQAQGAACRCRLPARLRSYQAARPCPGKQLTDKVCDRSQLKRIPAYRQPSFAVPPRTAPARA